MWRQDHTQSFNNLELNKIETYNCKSSRHVGVEQQQIDSGSVFFSTLWKVKTIHWYTPFCRSSKLKNIIYYHLIISKSFYPSLTKSQTKLQLGIILKRQLTTDRSTVAPNKEREQEKCGGLEEKRNVRNAVYTAQGRAPTTNRSSCNGTPMGPSLPPSFCFPAASSGGGWSATNCRDGLSAVAKLQD